MSFSKIQVYGNCDINYVWCQNKILSNEEITSIASKGVHTPDWNENTLLLATFREDLSASCFNQSKKLLGYKIQKRDCKNDLFNTVVDLGIENDSKCVQDYNIRNGSIYEYWIYPLFDSDGVAKYGNPIVCENIQTKWDRISVIGLKETNEDDFYEVDYDNIWTFSLNIQEGDIKPEYDKVYHDGFNRFSKGYSGKRNYIKSSISCLIGDVNCSGNYDNDDVYKLEKWQDFCNSNCLKLLKTNKGYVLPVDIENTSIKIDNNIIETPSTISFNYRQMMDANEISVFGLEVL